MIRRLAPFALATWLAAGGAHAWALPVELRDLVDAPEPAGCSDFGLLFWDFYRAELWSEAVELPGEEFGLSLTYKSDFTRRELVESSIDEMARISGRDPRTFSEVRWQLEESFRDVARGDRITAWRDGGDGIRFFHNGRETGRLTRDVELFLGIWLGEKARDRNGRQALLSGRCDG